MTFNLIIGNPPYSRLDGGGLGSSASSIYQLFYYAMAAIPHRFLSLLIPSRWLGGGKGLDDFREDMKNNKHLKVIKDYRRGKTVFPTTDIGGGICYMLEDTTYNGNPRYIHITKQGKVIDSVRPLRNKYSDAVIRDARLISILDKVGKTEYMSSIISKQKPFGIRTYLFNEPERLQNIELCLNPKENTYKIYGYKGCYGGGERIVGWINKDAVMQGRELIDKYKILMSRNFNASQNTPPERIICKPNEICTETFFAIGPFDTEQEAINCDKYIGTKFASCMLYQRKIQPTNTAKLFEYLPLQDFTEEWTDEKLYRKYGLNKADIDFIEENFKT